MVLRGVQKGLYDAGMFEHLKGGVGHLPTEGKGQRMVDDTEGWQGSRVPTGGVRRVHEGIYGPVHAPKYAAYEGLRVQDLQARVHDD